MKEMNNTELFKLMVEKQSERRQQYYQSKTVKQIVHAICNRKISNEMCDLEEVVMVEGMDGELCFQSVRYQST